MLRDTVTLARPRTSRVIAYAEIGPGRAVGTIMCGLSALYNSDDHDPTLIVDITDIFGGISPAATSGTRSIPALNTAPDPDTVYFGWEWFSMPWPGNPGRWVPFAT